MEVKHKVQRICDNCKYYRGRSCYRFPPNVIIDPTDYNVYTVHPSPQSGDRCGEWAIHPKLEKHESD